MEAFNFLKLWKTSPVQVGDLIPPPEYDDEDAFFDLEILNYGHKQTKFTEKTSESSDEDYNHSSPKSCDYSRSPISFLRSPPKFFKFKKTKISNSASPVLSRNNSNNNSNNNTMVTQGGPNGVVSKYLKMMKIRISGESELKEDSPWESPSRKGMRSPSMRIACRRFGKGRGSAMSADVSSVRSDSVVQSDGIQSAILHCKRSFHSSPTDLSMLSRSVSEPVISANPSRFSIEEKKRISI